MLREFERGVNCPSIVFAYLIKMAYLSVLARLLLVLSQFHREGIPRLCLSNRF